VIISGQSTTFDNSSVDEAEDLLLQVIDGAEIAAP
jgi:hypothetical protein